MEGKEKSKKTDTKRTKNAPRLWHLIVKNLKSMFRDKTELAWIIGYPLLFIVIFGVAFGAGTDRQNYNVVIFNEDGGVWSDEFVEIMESEDLEETLTIVNDYDDYEDAYEDLKYERIDAIIVIDSNFTNEIQNNGKPEVEITTITDEVVEGVIYSIVSEVVNGLSLSANGIERADIESEQVVDSVELTALDYLAPGFIIAGVTVCISQLSTHFAEEKQNKTLERLITTPVSRRDIILSGLVSQLVVCCVQVILMLLISILAFGVYVHPDSNIFLLFLIPVLFCFTCLGIALILASFYKTSSSTGITWLIILPLQFLGNVFTYGGDMPISTYIPTTYAVHAMRLVMTSGLTSWSAIGIDIVVLIITGIGFTIAGILLFNRETAIS